SIAVVDHRNPVGRRLQAESAHNLCADVEVDDRNGEISPGSDEPCDVAEAALGVGRRHVTEEIVGDDDVLTAEGLDDRRIARISITPRDALSQPRFDAKAWPIPIEHLPQLALGHADEDRL